MDEVVSNIREAGWLRAIKLCSQSGLTTRAWCKENNVNERQYYYWQKKIRSQAASNLSLDLDPVTTFAEVPAPVSGSASNADRAEQAIRNFVIGKKNWMMCDTIYGAKASAVLYSLVETAKANQLKPYEYLKYLLEVLPEKVQQKNQSFIDDLMPWSEKLPGTCKSL